MNENMIAKNIQVRRFRQLYMWSRSDWGEKRTGEDRRGQARRAEDFLIYIKLLTNEMKLRLD